MYIWIQTLCPYTHVVYIERQREYVCRQRERAGFRTMLAIPEGPGALGSWVTMTEELATAMVAYGPKSSRTGNPELLSTGFDARRAPGLDALTLTAKP